MTGQELRILINKNFKTQRSFLVAYKEETGIDADYFSLSKKLNGKRDITQIEAYCYKCFFETLKNKNNISNVV